MVSLYDCRNTLAILIIYILLIQTSSYVQTNANMNVADVLINVLLYQ